MGWGGHRRSFVRRPCRRGARRACRGPFGSTRLDGGTTRAGRPTAPPAHSLPDRAHRYPTRFVGPDRLERARERHGSQDYREAHGIMRAVLVRVLAEDYRSTLRRISAVPSNWSGENGTRPCRSTSPARRVPALTVGRLTVLPGCRPLRADRGPTASVPRLSSTGRDRTSRRDDRNLERGRRWQACAGCGSRNLSTTCRDRCSVRRTLVEP